MQGFLKSVIGLLVRWQETPLPKRDLEFCEIGFHGDRHLLRVVESVLADCQCFIETGTNVASTLSYVARAHPRIECFSCEPDREAYQEALRHTDGLANVHIYHTTSQVFMESIKRDRPEILTSRCLFWLDAHGYGFQWPLREEVSFITENFSDGCILIDDMKVPGRDQFAYDQYDGQICCFEHVRDRISPKVKYALYYPAYTERTSPHHALKGWGAILFWRNKELVLDKGLMDIVERAQI